MILLVIFSQSKSIPKMKIKKKQIFKKAVIFSNKREHKQKNGQCLYLCFFCYFFYIIYQYMNSSNEFSIVGKQGVQSKSILTEMKMTTKGIAWDYANNFQITALEEISPRLKISNQLPEVEGNKVKKVLEVIYKNYCYRVEDHYYARNYGEEIAFQQQNPREVKEISSTHDSSKNKAESKEDSKKVYIFKKLRRPYLKQGQDQHMRNTKNVSKNFCKAFVAFLKSKKSSTFQKKNIQQALKACDFLFHTKKYNNSLIKKIIGNQTLRSIFQYFLEEYAQTWINGSRVSDKPLHFQAIGIYLGLFNRVPLLEQAQQQSPSHQHQSSSPASSYKSAPEKSEDQRD